MRPATKSVTSATATEAVPMNWEQTQFNATLMGEISAGGSATFSFQTTMDNILDPNVTPVWTDLLNATGKTANFMYGLLNPVRAVRLNCTVYGSGTVYLKVLQGPGG